MRLFWRKNNVPVYEDGQKQKEYEQTLLEQKQKGEKNNFKELRVKYVEYLENEPVKGNYILYEAYGGRGMVCSPYTIFKYLLTDKRFKKFVHVWVIEDFEDNRFMIERYSKHKNVKFVEYLSLEYRKYLATAKYLINNVSFPGYFTKRKEQVYINTWHGIPLKTLGYDVPGGNVNAGNQIRNFLAADYMISPNAFMTEIYKKAFKLEGIYKGTILEEGQPRNDGYFHTERKQIIKTLQQYGVKVEPDKKIIMYAPTWKGNKYSEPDIGMEIYFEIIRRIEKNVDLEQYQVLVKPHQIVYKYIKDTQELTEQFIPAIVDTNEILSVVDILISDYSSIYFDYLVSEKPILFFIPDLEEYQNQRGLYFDVDKLPGPIAESYEELEAFISDVDRAMMPCWEKYREEKLWACPRDDGNVCERLVNKVFMEQHSEKAIRCDTSKKKLLLYGGPLAVNGITFSLFTLLKYVDYSKYDVTLTAWGAKDAAIAERINQIDSRVRVLYRAVIFNSTYEEGAHHELLMEHGLDSGYIVPTAMYEREIRRCYGEAEFDYVVEFSGYSAFYSVLFSFFKNTKKVIWMHNDLNKELSRGEKGGFDTGKSLKVCISAYPYYDKIVGCSKSIMEINRANFETERTAGKFTYARNLVSFGRIFAEEEIQTAFSAGEEEYYIAKTVKDVSSMKMLEVVPVPDRQNINFVTMGRLSPEKNQDSLIKAFGKLYRENAMVRLYILGEGPWRETLEKLIDAEGLKGIVHLLGALPNPFSFLKRCNCFILPSRYEGQPLVIQEARVLQMPIIVSKFESVIDVLMENGQLLVGQEVEDLYEGMKGFLEGKVAEYEFDCEAYNEEVYQEFDRIFTE